MVEELFRPRRDENGIPLLTEVISDNDSAASNSAEKNFSTVEAAELQSSATAQNSGSAPLEKFSLQLRDSLTQRILARLDPALEYRLNETTREVLEQAMPAVRAELQRALTETAVEVIGRAIHQEFAKITTPKK
jgi:hypothetical protein